MNPYLQGDIHQYISLNTYISKYRKVMDDYGENVGIKMWSNNYVKSKDISDAGMSSRIPWVYGFREDGRLRQVYSKYKEYPLSFTSISQCNILAFLNKETNEWYRSPIQRPFRKIRQLRGHRMCKCYRPHYYYTYPKGLPDWVKNSFFKKNNFFKKKVEIKKLK